MTHSQFEVAARNLYGLHANGGMSYAEYCWRYERLQGTIQSFASFRINGGTREQYDALYWRAA